MKLISLHVIMMGIFGFWIIVRSRIKIKSRIVKSGAYFNLVGSRNLSLFSNRELDPAHIMTSATSFKKISYLHQIRLKIFLFDKVYFISQLLDQVR